MFLIAYHQHPSWKPYG